MVTHDGSFHADEVFSTVILQELYPEYEIVRTRDQKIIDSGFLVYDIGGIYNPQQNRFDHHMKDGPKRENNHPYSSFGLIWKFYGQRYLAAIGIETQEERNFIWKYLDEEFITWVDQEDCNGAKDKSLTINKIVAGFNPNWDESNELVQNQQFQAATNFARGILGQQIHRQQGIFKASQFISEAYEASKIIYWF